MAETAPLTTFVQTDATGFRELVQRLTGLSPEADAQQSPRHQSNDAGNEGAVPKVAGLKRSMSKLQERRQYMMSKLEIDKLGFQIKPGSNILYSTELVFSPSKSVKLSFIASPLGTPSKAFSNLSIKEEEEKEEEEEEEDEEEEEEGEGEGEAKLVLSDIDREEEEKAIKQRRFYLHSSPLCRSGNAEPELLHLFPLASTKMSHESWNSY